MRFVQNKGRIDLAKTEEQIMEAYSNGINYFDTAYLYPGSEAALGEILEKNQIRDNVYIATKLPHYRVNRNDDFDKFFEEELSRLRTSYVDYYLCHMLTDIETWERLKALGIIEWIKSKKDSGAIKQIGFSYHGNADMFIKLIDAFEWDF